MSSGTNIRQRDIVLVPFPFSDLSQSKKRPAVIISNKEYNSKNEDIVCCAVTSNLQNCSDSVEIGKSDLESGHLDLKSIVKPAKLFTLKRSAIIRNIARLNIKNTKDIITSLNLRIKIDE